jgi:hypothetical protein
MDFGFFCWRFCIWENEILIFWKNLTLQKFHDRFYNARDLILAQFGIHGQRENFLRGALGVREVASVVAERCVQLLQVQRVGIVDGAADFSLTEEFLEGVALFDANGVLVVDVFESVERDRRHHAGDLREESMVFRGVRLPGALPIRKMAQLHAQDRRLDFI